MQNSMSLFDVAPRQVPILTTERLVLRGHTAADFDDCAAMWGSSDVTRFISGKPLSREESWSRFLRAVGHWAVLGYGYWVVQERASGRFVGDVGLADFQRELTPSYHGEPEAGWVLAPWAHGKGYATEAVRAVLGWAGQRLTAARVLCVISPQNEASLNVARKCGFVELAATTYSGGEVLLFERRTVTGT